MSGRPCWRCVGGQEQSISLLWELKLNFHVNSSRKNSIVLNNNTPPTWPPCHVAAIQEYTSHKTASYPLELIALDFIGRSQKIAKKKTKTKTKIHWRLLIKQKYAQDLFISYSSSSSFFLNDWPYRSSNNSVETKNMTINNVRSFFQDSC